MWCLLLFLAHWKATPISIEPLAIPAGLPDAQTLILVEKPSNGDNEQRYSAGTVFTT
jgi:hypothetical protein